MLLAPRAHSHRLPVWLADIRKFKDHLIEAGAQGGVKAAQLLNDSVRDLVHERLGSQADQCRIMVRIYSNVLGLSKALTRADLVGQEARSLATFASSFTAAQELFDYVDAGDKKEGADYKIREMFRLFADNNQCKHIFFAGCHDTGYLSLLTPYRGRTDRITLIKAASFHHEFSGLEFAVRELPAVFMATQIGETPIPTTIPSASKTTPSANKICTHFLKGNCRYGDQYNTTGVRDWKFYASSLPPASLYGLPSRINLNTYAERAKSSKLCNDYHLAKSCTNENCQFDHGSISPDLLNTMKYILRQCKCSKGGSCRSIKCYFGHHCQKSGCRGGKPSKFAREGHTLDVDVTRWDDAPDHYGPLFEDSPVTGPGRPGLHSAEVGSFNQRPRWPRVEAIPTWLVAVRR
ncbi:hypothetical protein BDV06DRAFT_215744 [Aspergillus oleicola]